MADVKISGLPNDTSLDSTHYIPLVDPNGTPTTKRTTLSTLMTWMQSVANWITGGMLANATITKTQVNFTTSGGIWWEELGRTTLSVAGDTITVSSLAARKFLEIHIFYFNSGGNIDTRFTFNGDTGANYNYRRSVNGGADATAVSQANLELHGSATIPVFYTKLQVINTVAQEKIVTTDISYTTAAGATNNNTRIENSARWSNTAAQISSITVTNVGAGDFGIGSAVVVLGHD